MKTLILLPVVIVLIIWRGFAISTLWLWFVVSTFGLAPLGVAQSIGLALIASVLCSQYFGYQDKDKSETERLAASVAYQFLSPAAALFTGWIAKGYL